MNVGANQFVSLSSQNSLVCAHYLLKHFVGFQMLITTVFYVQDT